jgi:hypothetical protein
LVTDRIWFCYAFHAELNYISYRARTRSSIHRVRRQVPIANYIADFVCHAARLVIELDGGQHFSDQAEQADARRSAVIEAKGFQVLRFSNHDVMTSRGCAGHGCDCRCGESPHPNPPPQERERGLTGSGAKASYKISELSFDVCP